MKRSRIKSFYLSKRVTEKDAEGVPVVSWGEPVKVEGEIWPAGGMLQVNTYGDSVNNMLNVKIKGAYEIVTDGNHQVYRYDGFDICEGDGLRIYSDAEPDYVIRSITSHKPLKLEVEKRWH